MLPTQVPYQTFTDLDGDPLDEGSVYYGVANANPVTSPIPIFWDYAGTQPAAQPVKTLGGYQVRFGTPASVYASSSSYSVSVYDKKGRLVYYVPDSANYNVFSLLGDTTDAAKGAALIGYKLNETGAVGRTVADRLTDYVSVKDFGAKGDGTTNDTAAILAAGTACERIYFPPGTYLISNVAFPQTVQMFGAGKFKTIIKTNTTTGSVITWGGNGSGIRDIGFDANTTRTGGAYISANGMRYCFAKDLHFTKYFIGIDIDTGCSGIDIAGISALDGTPSSTAAGGSLIRLGNSGYCGPINISDVVADVNNPANQPSAGIVIKYADVVAMKGVLIIHHGIPLDITPAAGQTASLIAVSDSCFDTSSSIGCRLFPAATGAILRSSFANCTFSANGGDGLQANGVLSAVRGILFADCNFSGNSAIGVNVVGSGAQDIYFANCTSGGNTGNGLQITSSASNIKWDGGALGATGGLAGNAYGVAVDASIANAAVLNTYLEGNLTGRISDPSNKIVQAGNTPYGWENYTATTTSTAGSLTTVNTTALYKRNGKTVHIRLSIGIADNGTGSGGIRVTLPSTSVAGAGQAVSGRATAVSGKACVGVMSASGTTMDILNYDGTYPGVSGETLVLTGSYEEA